MTTKRQTRFAGTLKPLTSYSIPKYLIFLDTETTSIVTEDRWYDFNFLSGVANYVELDKEANIKYEHSEFFNNPLDMLKYIRSKGKNKQVVYVFSHNLGFDLPVLGIFSHLHDLSVNDKNIEIKSDFPILGNRRFIWSVRINQATFKFIDTANYGVSTVEQLGIDIKLPKLKIDFDNCTPEELNTYNKRDADIIQKFVIEFIKYIHTNKLGSFRYTLASQALTAYRTRFMSDNIVLHNHQPALNMERKAYHGARVECLRIGSYSGETFYKLDVNSMYPYCMRSFNVPIEMKRYYPKMTIEQLKRIMQDNYVIAEVEIIVKDPKFAYVHNNKLCFPIGHFITTLNDCELRRLEHDKDIIRVIRCTTYKQSVIFRDYVDFFYTEKIAHTLSGNTTYRAISKLFQNSLYGKFSQNGIVSKPIKPFTDMPFARRPGSNRELHLHFAEIQWFGKAVREIKQGESTFSFPGIAGAITANARLYLYDLMVKAGLENVYYVDTDSLIVNKNGYERLSPYIDETKLGYLKLEATTDILTIYGAKDYIFDLHAVHKGVPKRSIELDNNSWEFMQFSSFISRLNQHKLDGASAHVTTRRRISDYNKGIVDKDTGIVSPIVIDINQA